MASTMTTEEGALRGAPSIDALRRARLALNEAIADGAPHLAEVRDLVEDDLIEALQRERRSVYCDPTQVERDEEVIA